MGRAKKVTRAERNIAWIEEHCRVPEGKLVGQRVVLLPFQRAEMRKIYDNPAGTRTAIISFGRKNGKTALAAFLLLLHLVGPEARPNSSLYSAAQTRDQASILFTLAAKVVRQSPTLSEYVNVRDTKKQLHCAELGTLYSALAAEAPQTYGLSPVFIVHDELGQVKGPTSELYEALETATAAQEQPLSIIISTQAPTDSDLLSVLIDDALSGADPKTVVSLYTAPLDADPFDESTIKLANPAYGKFQNPDEVLAMAERARRMPARESSYRNLVLNQRVTVTSPYISKQVWDDNNTAPRPFSRTVYGGLDLSEVNDLTALELVEPPEAEDGLWGVESYFWLPEEGLVDRARNDRVPYDLWHEQGYIELVPGRSVDYGWVAKRIWRLAQRYTIGKIFFDRYNWRHLRPWLLEAGFTTTQVDGNGKDDKGRIFEEFGQGFVSMSPALRDLESLLLNAKMAHGAHPVLTMCAGNAVVKSDDAGNRKLTKVKSYGRIDGMVSLTMAVAAAAQGRGKAPSVYKQRGVLVL